MMKWFRKWFGRNNTRISLEGSENEREWCFLKDAKMGNPKDIVEIFDQWWVSYCAEEFEYLRITATNTDGTSEQYVWTLPRPEKVGDGGVL